MAYYTRMGDPPGTWEGRGAVALGLSGTVEAEVAERLYQEGVGPGGERITPAAGLCAGTPAQHGRAAAARSTLRSITLTRHAGRHPQPPIGQLADTASRLPCGRGFVIGSSE